MKRLMFHILVMILLFGSLLSFATIVPASANPTEVICDNHDPCFTSRMSGGQWGYIQPASPGVTGRGNSTYAYARHAYYSHNESATIDYGRWTPILLLDGVYHVSLWYAHDFPGDPDTESLLETNSAHYVVHHADGDSPITVDQSQNYGRWNEVATVRCRAGTDCYVQLNDQTDEPADTRKVWFDAVKFEWAGAFDVSRPQPTLTAITPNQAVKNAENVPVVISGDYFEQPTTVQIGDVHLLSVTVATSTTIHAVVPIASLSEGRHDLVVTTAGVTRTLANAFTVLPQVPETQFRVMVLMACDNDLGAYGVCDELFNDLELVMTRNPDVRILVLWDGQHDRDSAYYLVQPDSNPSTRASYTKGENYFPQGEVNTGHANTIVEFAGWAQGHYPGQYKMMSLIGHGGGWAPDLHPAQPRSRRTKTSPEPFGGIFWDEHPASTLATRPLAEALAWIKQGYNIEVLYLDACLMGSLEIMAELAPYTDYIVAHENVTWANHPYVDYLANVNSATTPEAFARHIAQVNRDAWPSTGHPDQVAVIASRQVARLVQEVNNLAKVLMHTSDDERAAIRDAVLATAHVDESNDLVINTDDSSIDLRDFATRLTMHDSITPSIKSAAQNINGMMDGVVITNYTLSGTPWLGGQAWNLEELHGLSLYFPQVDEWKRAFYNAEALPQFAAGAPDWINFLRDWFNGQNPPAPPTTPCVECPAPPLNTMLSVGITTTARVNDLVWAQVYLNQVRPEDDLHGVQFRIITSDPTILEPAIDQSPRFGELLATGSLSQSIRLSNGWDFLLNVEPSSGVAITGTGLVVELPFYARRVGAAALRFDSHALINNAAQSINYRIVPTSMLVVSEAPADSNDLLKGVSYLEGRIDAAGIMVVAQGAERTYTTTTTSAGLFSMDTMTGTYTLLLTRTLFVGAERVITVTHTTPTTPEIGLWAGDMDGNGEVQNTDWRVCAASSHPVNDPDFDLNGDGITDVYDCQLVANNVGRLSSEMRTTNAPRKGADMDRNLQLQSMAETGQITRTNSLRLIPLDDHTIQVQLKDIDSRVYAIGALVQLSPGEIVTHVDIPDVFTGKFRHWRQKDSALYIAMDMGDGGYTTAEGVEIARIHLDTVRTGTTGLAVTAANVVTSPGPSSRGTIFLPMLQR